MLELPFATYDLAPNEFQRRMAWAKSRGVMTWPWPDITVAAWRSAREDVTDALAEVLRYGAADKPLTGDPDTLSLAAFTAGLGPLIGWWIAEGRVTASDDVAAVMDLHLRHNRIRMGLMRERAMGVVDGLGQRSVSASVLKGMHTAFVYFPDPATRPMGDIDLVVDPDAADPANAYFEESGYTLKYRSQCEYSWAAPNLSSEPRSLMLTHSEDPWTVDLHRSLNYSPSPMPPARLDRRDDPAARPPWSCDPRASVLPQPLLLLHLAAHASSCLNSMTPLRMAEAVMVIRRDTALGTLCWPDLIEMGKAAGALGVIFPLLYFAEAIAPTTVPADVLEASATAAPPGVRRALSQWSPAHIQQIERQSVKEHFLWCNGLRDVARRILYDLTPDNLMPSALLSGYQARALRILKASWNFDPVGGLPHKAHELPGP